MSCSANPLKNQHASIFRNLKVGCCFENEDWYLLDAQKVVMSGAESGDTPQEPQPEPEPVVTGGRFSDFLFDSLEATV